MARVISVCLPMWPIDRLRRVGDTPSDSAPLILSGRAGSRRVVTAACDRALALGLRPGMPVSKAQAMIPDLRVEPADPDADMASPAAPGEDPLRERTGISAGIPIWGAWCGPGHGGGEPEDTFDTLCMRHDRCYIERGYFDCWCDARFRDEIQRFGPQMETRERVAAAATETAPAAR